jgi:hypothetical protein
MIIIIGNKNEKTVMRQVPRTAFKTPVLKLGKQFLSISLGGTLGWRITSTESILYALISLETNYFCSFYASRFKSILLAYSAKHTA